ncbi:MAG TPA: two-component regulator propeller domain-containing protein [Bacteroidales bacterium]|nr:two-component regulator propeller domain-containing protein [Bacteroidales bacterium]
MNRIIFRTVFLFFSFLITAGFAQNSIERLTTRNYTIKSWKEEQGFNDNIYALAVTAEGFIWLGSTDGITRFDGTEGVLFNRHNVREMTEDDCSFLYVGSDNTLYAGLFNGLLLGYRNGIFKTIGTREIFQHSSITAICEVGPGNLCIVPDGKGIVMLNHKKVSHFNVSSGLLSDEVTAICPGSGKELWVATDRGLCRIAGGKVQPIPSGNRRPVPLITSMAAEASGKLWLGGNNGSLWSYDREQFTPIEPAGYRGGFMVKSLYLSRDGKALWIGTSGDGLYQFDLNSRSVLRFCSQNGLGSDLVECITEDRRGSVLAGTQGGGLTRITRNRIHFYTTEDGLQDQSVMGIGINREGEILIGHENGRITSFRNGMFSDFTRELGMPGMPVFSIAFGPEDQKLAATVGALVVHEKGRRSMDRQYTGLNNSLFHALFFDREGTLWAGTDEGIYRVKNNQVNTLTLAQGLTDDRIFCFMEDDNHRIWIGTQEGGISVFDNGKITGITTKDGLSDNMVLALYEDRDHIVWAGTGHNGLNRIDSSTGKIRSLYDLINEPTITYITGDDQGRLWVGTGDGIYSLVLAEVSGYINGTVSKPRVFYIGSDEGMLSSACTGGVFPAGVFTRDHKIWFSTDKGIAEIDPLKMEQPMESPEAVITELICNRDTFYINKPVKLPAGVIHLEIRFTAPWMESPEKLKFRYKLEGYDKVWSAGDGTRFAHYTKVPPGDYTFKLEVSDRNGQWNGSQTAVTFSVAPFFYQSWWFILLCVLAALLILYGIVKFRIRQIRDRELEILVAKRTDEIRRLNENLEQQVNDRTAQLLVTNSELEAFTFSVSHDLRAPVRRIDGLITALVEDYGDRIGTEAADLLAKIMESTRSIGQLIEEFLKLSRIARHELELTELDLTRLVEDILQKLRQQYPERSVGVKIQPGLTVVADGSLVQIVIQNLLDNAWKYTGKKADGLIEIGTTIKDGRSLYFIRDNGAGFDMNHYQKLFVPFQRLHSDDQFTGTGIGLATVKRIISRHGGVIFAESEPGVGTTFYFSFSEMNITK